jgi:hypothetical protein
VRDRNDGNVIVLAEPFRGFGDRLRRAGGDGSGALEAKQFTGLAPRFHHAVGNIGGYLEDGGFLVLPQPMKC